MSTIRSRSTAVAVCLVAGPLALMVEHLLLDPISADTNGGQLVIIARHHDAYVLGNLVGLLGAVLMVPAVYGVAGAIQERGSRLATWSAALVTIACVATGGVMTGGLLMAAMASTPGHAEMTAALDAFTTSPGAIVVIVAFLGGITLTLWTLAAAVWRSRIAPRWVAVVIVVLPFLDFAFNGGVLGELAGVGSWLALTAAFGRIAVSVLRDAGVVTETTTADVHSALAV